MSDSVGSISVKMGVDLAEFDSGLRKAADDATAHVGRISAGMKQTAREGSESLRVIDEMIGIHLNRPLTRLIVEKFPALAEGLAGALNTVAFGAVGFAVTELGARIVAGIEKAKKAQEELQDTTRKTQQVFEDAMASYAKSDQEVNLRMAGLRGDVGAALRLKLLEIDSANVERAKKDIDALTDATEKQAKAAEDAGHWYTALLADIGTAWDFATEGQAGLNLDVIDKQMEVFKENIAETSRLDALHGTHLTAIELTEELNQARNTLEEMKAVNEGRVEKGGDFRASGLPGPGPFTDAEMAKQNALVDLKQRSLAEQSSADKLTVKLESAEKMQEAIEAQKKAIRDVQDELKGWNEENNKAFETWLRLNEQVDQAIKKFQSEGFQNFGKRQEDIHKQIAPYLPTVAPPPGAPMRTDLGELQKLQEDPLEQWEKAGSVIDSIETPLQKYATALAEVMSLQSRLSPTEFAAAQKSVMDQYAEALTKAADQTHKLQEEMQKLLERSTSASAGVEAFWKQMQIGAAENGKFTFDILSKGFEGIEENLAKAATTGGQNWRMRWREEWQALGREMEASTLKFAMNKAVVGIGSELGKTGIGGEIGGMISKHAGGMDLTSAGATLHAAGVQLLAAATALQGTAFQSVGSSSAFAAGPGAIFGGLIPHESGGDVTPGQGYLVGEGGPEPFFPKSAGTVMPHESLKGAADVHNHYYDLRGADPAAVARLERALPMIEDRAVARAQSMQRESGLRKRPG